jgi:hypothetical protein
MNNLYLVIRVGLQDGVDPIAEIDKVIKRKGFCWFAKYGNAIAPNIQNRIEEKNDVVLCLIYKKEDKYVMKSYKAVEISRDPQIIKGTYPTYYNKFIDRVGVFVKIIDIDEEQVSIDSLYIVSSLNKLHYGLHNSMRGHFICKKSNTRY